jgi:ParB family chromosome partitioning protein
MRSLAQISMTKIDQKDTFACITFMPDLNPLRASIQLTGIIEPIILRERRDGRYQIVCGFKRIDVLRHLGRDKVESLVYPQGELDNQQAILLALGHNLIRPCNLVEKALSLEKLLSCGVSEHEIIDYYLPLLGLQPHKGILQQVTGLLQLERGLQEYLVVEGLSLSAASQFLCLDQEGQLTIMSLLEALRPGENRVKEIISFLLEVARRDGTTISAVLTAKEITHILSDQETSRPRRLEQLRRALKRLRFSRLCEIENKFAAYRRSLSLPPQINFAPPPFFEGKDFKMELRFKDFKEFRDLVSRLHMIVQGEGEKLDGLLDPLIPETR